MVALTRTLLLLGYGDRAAQAIKTLFLSAGFNVATVSRKERPELVGVNERLAHWVGDLTDPSTIDKIFSEVITKFGPVSTVIYNAGSLTPPPIRTSPFSLPLSDVTLKHTPSVYRAAQLLLEQPAPAVGKRVLIHTGNILHLPGHVWLVGFAQAVDKGASAKVIEYGARAYGAKDEAYFYNAFQSTASGGVPPIASLSAESHGDICLKLAQTTKQERFDVPFYWDAEGRRAKRVEEGVELESESAWFAGK